MQTYLDACLSRLPQSTDHWDCPWYRAIMILCVMAVVLGLVAGNVVSFGASVSGAAIGGWVTGRRANHDGEGATC